MKASDCRFIRTALDHAPSEQLALVSSDLQKLVLVKGEERITAEWQVLELMAALVMEEIHDVDTPGSGVSLIEFTVST